MKNLKKTKKNSSEFKNLRVQKKNSFKNWVHPYRNISEFGSYNKKFLSFVKDLIAIGAFSGSKFTRMSHEHLANGSRNFVSFYNLPKSIELFANAVKFLENVRKNKKSRIVILGNPPYIEDEIQKSLRKRNLCFFDNKSWPNGFLSKNSRSLKTQNSILIVYKPGENSDAVNEAVYCNIPVLAFASPSCNIENLDYPVVLNLEKAGLWYIYFLNCFFT